MQVTRIAIKNKSIASVVILAVIGAVMLSSGPTAQANVEAGTPDTSWYVGDGPYTLYDADDLAGLSQLVSNGNSFSGKTILLGADIDLSGYKDTPITINNEKVGEGWTPIGNGYTMSDWTRRFVGSIFSGTFDGQGHTIRNLSINVTNGLRYSIGLFGVIGSKSRIANVNVEAASVYGQCVYIGGIVGISRSASIDNCSFSGTVSASDFDSSRVNSVIYVGGLIGSSDESTITNCSFFGTVSATNIKSQPYIGGIVAHNKKTVQGCFSSGTIFAGGFDAAVVVGGIAGKATNAQDCYSRMDVGCELEDSRSWSYVGGLFGIVQGRGGRGVIMNCYSTGALSADYECDDSVVGGIAAVVTDVELANCLALNSLILSRNRYQARVGLPYIWDDGSDDYGVLVNNYAWPGMLKLSKSESSYPEHGEAVTLAQIKSATFQKKLFTNTDAWSFADGRLPVLVKAPGVQTGELPAHLTGTLISPSPGISSAIPSPSNVLIDGKAMAFESYLIGGNNYFKLRDLAIALNGTAKQFEIGYNTATKAITLTSKTAYTSASTELTFGDGKAKIATPTVSKIYLDGGELDFIVYNINNNNFFKLRDLMSALDVSVGYDSITKNITLDTSKGYGTP